mmetsp:Transcript_137987/g.239948  ORF Transcript_137987/g.239948 Transcript_137987/m.239948 type:complete len:85 (-) Transcript_137987:314-568(-)
METFCLPLVFHLEERLVARTLNDFEWPVLHISLDFGILKLAANESLGIKNGVSGISRCLALCCIADEPVRFGESNERRCRALAL